MRSINPDEVIELVRKEVGLYSRLLGQEERKSDLLIKGEIQSLEQSTVEGERIIGRIKSCEERLKKALRGSSLTECIRFVEEPHRIALKGLVNRFRGLVSELKLVNRRNFERFRLTMSFNRAMLEEVFQLPTEYDSAGRVHSGAAGSGHRQNFSY